MDEMSNYTNSSEFPFVSVVICTYNRKNMLKTCLSSVYMQNYPKNRFEIIVVDGGSTDGTRELCKEFPKLRFVVEHKFGLAHARNKGAKLSKGSIISYTDDDCVVDESWLMNLIRGFQYSKSVMGVGGPVYPLRPDRIPDKIHVKDALGLFYRGTEAVLTDGLITSNVAFKKEIFKKIIFDESLGITRKSKLILAGEDTFFCKKIIESGYSLMYIPDSKVFHNIPCDRIRISYILKRGIHSGVTKTRIFLKQKQSRMWAIRYSLVQLMQTLLKIPVDRSFTSCYLLVYSISTFFVSISGLDKIL
ncbi:MAG: glycosyltransferase [Candidatus Bathyarchaeota archaeon]|nr:MAG: glycosyltransferase [Candidatus Bathyarchaeota archaeon]